MNKYYLDQSLQKVIQLVLMNSLVLDDVRCSDVSVSLQRDF